jgi:hypothetical protein
MKQDVKDRHEAGCCCPVCRGLKAFDQPLWGPGQLLSAADLTSLQTYIKAKNRLHNRYLHGWGVVCGLEVVCDDCEGYVTIRPGYAIDPCGEDIVVAQDTPFNVVAAIRACCDAQRAKTGLCDPWQPPPDPGCREAETHWCIALKYKEVETAYVRTLPVAPPPQSCGCGKCSDKGHANCDCGCGGSKGATAQSAPSSLTAWSPSTGLRPSNNSCVPRRLLECFDVTVIESPHGCLPQYYDPRSDLAQGQDKLGLGYLKNVIPEDSLLYRILACFLEKFAAYRARFNTSEQNTLESLFDSATPAPGVTSVQIHALVCRFKQFIMEMLASDDHPVRCQMRKAAAEIVLAAPTEADTAANYWLRARDAYVDLVAVFFQLIIDCICHAFLPQCDDDPCDDRVEIACVTVRGDKILRICNHSCRHYAGAFPAVFYWMSLVPIIPLIGKLLATACCQPDLLRKNSPLVNDLMPLLDTVDPTGNLRRTLTANNFAVPRFYFKQLTETAPMPFVSRLLAGFEQGTAPAAYVGTPVADARKTFKAAGINATEKSIGQEDPEELNRAMMRKPLLQPGDNATVYTSKGRVVAVVPEEAPSLASLRDEVAQLRRQVAALSTRK